MESHKRAASGQYECADHPQALSPKMPPSEAPGLPIGIRYKQLKPYQYALQRLSNIN
jgi:hypothetical protein